MKQQITVWPDDTEGRQNRRWIVSLDNVETIGNESISGQTLADFPSVAAARKAGIKEGDKRKLAVVEQNVGGEWDVIA